MSNLQTYYHFKLDFQKVDQHTGGEWLIHGTKSRKDNQLQSLECYLMVSKIFRPHWDAFSVVMVIQPTQNKL